MHRFPILIAGACLALLPFSAIAQGAASDPHWMRDGQTFCRIYNPFPEPGETVAWNGPTCRYAEAAHGEGELTWFKDGKWTIKERGKMVDGKMDGEWSRRLADGTTEQAHWINGTRLPDSLVSKDVGTQTSVDASASSNPSTGGGYRAPPSASAGDAYLETLKRQNRENCARAAQGANIVCNPQ